MRKVLLYCLLFVASSSFILHNSNSFSDFVKNRLTTYTTENWPEKVYVHTDKPYYTLDEELWFSSYLINGITHEESSKSTVVYVELINEADSIVDSKRLFIDQLSAGGHFKINKNWLPGNYLLRAYTNYMRNEDSNLFFQKEIQLISLNKGKTGFVTNSTYETQDILRNLEKPDLQFFPEGGYLVENLNSKVAIKIKDPRFHNYKLPIEIIDSEGLVLRRLNTEEFGLGHFYINPQSDRDYYANLYLNGQVYQYLLPKALTAGYGLNINFKKDGLLIGLSTTHASGLNNSYLMVHQRGKVLFDKVATTNKKSDIISIYTGNLQDGVTHVTLFNGDGQPVCERLIFIDNPQNKVSVDIAKNKEELKSRERVSLNLQIQNSNGSNLAGNISLTVRDLDAIPQNEYSANIKTWLLLNSDLHGKIDNPGYFFSKGELQKKKFLLDLVMMTNGWRRFTWQNILQDYSNDNTFEIEKGITISGTTKTLEPPYKEVTAINTITLLGKNSINTQSANSNNDGKFSFGPYVFYDSIQTIVQSKLVNPALKTADSYRNVLISIDKENSTSPEIMRRNETTQVSTSVALNDEFLEAAGYIRDLNMEYDKDRELLDEVVLTATKKTPEQEREIEMEERSFFGSPTRRLDVESDKFLSKATIDFAFSKFPGIRIGDRQLFYRGEPCRILFNNMDVDLSFFKSLNPSDISFIEFYYGASAAVYSGARGGVFAVYEKFGVDAGSKQTERRPGIINFTSKGFDSAKEFYAPDYSKELDNMTRTDVRTTLHWEPKIRLDGKNTTKEVSFYTCDMKGTYLIEIEGMTDSGIPIHEISYFSVN